MQVKFKFLAVLLSNILIVVGFLHAQNDSMYIMKSHNVISAYNLAKIDSVVFYNPYNQNINEENKDSLYVLKGGEIIGIHSIINIDSILFRKPADALIPLPRIGTREGQQLAEFYNTNTGNPPLGPDETRLHIAEFYNTHTGEVFKPTGSSYVRLTEVSGNLYHTLFAEGLYDSRLAEEALAKMEESGFNLVRIFIYKGQFGLRPILSIEGPYETNTPELYQPYLDNMYDFLERATRHRIYVQLSIDQTPQNKYYDNLVFYSGFPQIEGSIHREYLVPNAITAKEIYIDKLIQGIKKHNPGLLSTVFAYEIRNEIHSETKIKPFSLTTGLVATAAGEYDMGDAVSRQACQDDNISLYLNRCVARIKQNDPAALTTSSSFTFLPVGKEGLAGSGLLPVDMKDDRWPVRLNIMAQTNIDFIDVHSYMPDDFNRAAESSLFSLVDKTKKPLLAGEFGAHRKSFVDVNAAADALYLYRESIISRGFQGALLFTWDTYEHTRWTMLEDGEVIMNKLKP